MANIKELYGDLDASLDYTEYAQIERRDPRLAAVLQKMVEGGVTPQKIALYIIDTRPHKWIESQAILAACRYLRSQAE